LSFNIQENRFAVPRLLFLHANGFPTGSYQQFLDTLNTHALVQAPDIMESPPHIAGPARWQHLTDWLTEDLDAQSEQTVLIGHSKGGFVSLMAAARCGGPCNHWVCIPEQDQRPLRLGADSNGPTETVPASIF
jgi:pimeloyl-ACP methyl ester carboxylesterase